MIGIDYMPRDELTHTVFKVETHNHPTAISPFPAHRPAPAARFAMRVRPDAVRSRRRACADFRFRTCASPTCATRGNSIAVISPGPEAGDLASRIADALSIIIDGPIGAAAFNNEFGRPNLLGYFRTTSKTSAAGATAITSRS